MSFDPGLLPLKTISNKQLVETFKCGPQGGMRRSLKTNTLVLVSDHTRGIYEDRWIYGILHYTGMGLTGDQDLEFAQNKTLAQSRANDVTSFLFEVFKNGEYVFRGPVELAGEPYQDVQPDKDGIPRKVWVFPLQIIDQGALQALPASIIQIKQDKKEKEAQRLSIDELRKRIKYSKRKAGTRTVLSTTYERNAYVSELVKRKANGICQLCHKPAPFNDEHGEPFLESHHIVWLSEGGEDSIENCTALCPNCHRKMHVLNLKSDVSKLRSQAFELVF